VLTKVINKLDNICEKNNVDGLLQTIDDAMDAKNHHILSIYSHSENKNVTKFETEHIIQQLSV